ncbi:hypothetical protein VUR80DRAFT_8850 [Thermomyces stellatus]
MPSPDGGPTSLFPASTRQAFVVLAGVYGAADQPMVLGNIFIVNMVEQLAQGLAAAEKLGLGTGPLPHFIKATLPGA